MSHDPRVLVDFRTQDDAGVYALDGETALVQTVDFFTPIVDDPFAYGQIAAANAVSDIYAMGGTPITALSIAAIPPDLDASVAAEIVRGGVEMLRTAGVALLGGHSVRDTEVKFGYAITGFVKSRDMWTNAGARPGDVLLLTKALGTGVVATAIKRGVAPDDVAQAAVASMKTLNRQAADVLRQLPTGSVHACTDVTGFGLAGHAMEMAVASRVTLRVAVDRVPLLPGARDLAGKYSPGGTSNNRQHFGTSVILPAGLETTIEALLYDPQTSGGLLVALDPAAVPTALVELDRAGVSASAVGEVVPPATAAVEFVPTL